MLNYLLRRICIGVITLGMITFIVYGLIRAMPGSPLTITMNAVNPEKEISDEDYKRMEALYGLDKPWHVAYFHWMGNVLTFDLGHSIPQKQPVTKIILARMGPTLALSVISLSLTYLLSVPLGLYATARANSTDERTVSTVLYMLYSFPSFVAALLLQLVFAVWLSESVFGLPLMNMTSDNYDKLSFLGKVGDIARHMILPVTCYTYGSLAYYSRFIKSNMQEVIRQDYIRTARAKGVGPVRVLCHHAFRNTLIPFLTLLGFMLPVLLSGSIILEQIFSWPGMGQLFFESIQQRDYPVLMGLVLLFSKLTPLGQLLADILYAWADPRVSYS